MSDTYNYNSGPSPFGGMGGFFGGCGNGFGNNLMDIVGLAIVAGIFGLGNAGWGGGFGGWGGRAMPMGCGGGGFAAAESTAALTASLVGQQQVADRVASINTGVDAVAGIATANGVKLETVKDAVVNGFYANQTGLCQAFNNAAMVAMNNQNATTALLNDMRFEAAKCCCDTKGLIESKFCNLTHQIQSDKCETLAAIRAEGDATRAMLRDMDTAKLREELAAAKAQLREDNQTAKIAALIQAQYGIKPYGSNCGCNPCATSCGNVICAVQDAFAEQVAQRIINPTTTAAAA